MTAPATSDDSDAPRTIVWDEVTLARFWAYQARFPENYFSYQKGADVVRHVRAYLPQGARVVDYGCGPGHLLPHLLEAGYRVTGAEIDLGAIGKISEQFWSRAGFEGLVTIDELLSQNKAFDGVFLIEVVEHLEDASLARTLTNAHRLLKPGGLLFVTTPNDERLEDNMVYCPVSNVVFHRWQHVRSWSAESLAAALKRHGFAVVAVKHCSFRDGSFARLSALRRLAGQVMMRLRKPQSLFVVAQC
jgi:2-polyprenyl-3-methyl-5-hydroxy-6-metoxy-1,4-benzoquinol methylase